MADFETKCEQHALDYIKIHLREGYLVTAYVDKGDYYWEKVYKIHAYPNGEREESEQMAKKPKTLKEIAIELLEKYEASETTAIWEYSPNIRLSEEMLKKEVAKYRKMIDKADRKTENSSEKPNNCEECKHWNDTEDGCADRHGCKTTEDWQDWKDRMWAEAIVTEPTTEDCSTVPTSSKMEQVDEPQTIRCPKCGRTDYIRDMEKDMGIKGSHYKYKCINCNTYIKDKPQTETQTETQNSNLTFEKRTMRDCYNCKRYETEGECIECHYEPKDEATISKMEQVDEPYIDIETGILHWCGWKYKRIYEDEPQTDCPWK